jgi:hypothetical protein
MQAGNLASGVGSKQANPELLPFFRALTRKKLKIYALSYR